MRPEAGGMGRSTFVAIVLLLGAVGAVRPALAVPERFEYRVLHPTFGDIGTYANFIERSGEDTEVRSELKIAVRMVGIVVYRQEAHRTERWHGSRLVGFDGLTEINGDRIEVHGAARDGGFVINSPGGTVLAPANVRPSNPWSVMVLNSDALMSTRDGKLMRASVSGGGIEWLSIGGRMMPLRRYEVDSNHRDFVWFDESGIPIKFRAEEHGTMVDFVLTQPQVLAGRQ
jgi:uncharacterized protein DUF6134